MTTRAARPPGRRRLLAVLSFLAWFTGQFLRANVVVLREVLTPGHRTDPSVVEVGLRSHSAVEIASLMSLVSLTPGTLALDLTTGARGPKLIVHGMHATEPERLRARVLEMEDRLLACLRRPTLGDIDRTEEVP